jgi:hypothetical protein
MRFSERIGSRPVKVEIQRESMDDDLRIGLWNVFKLLFLDNIENRRISLSSFDRFFTELWMHFFKRPLETMSDDVYDICNQLREWFFSWDWDYVYDFIEYVPTIPTPIDREGFQNACNRIMERELSAYRFVGQLITPITDEQEVQEIEDAIDNARDNKLVGVKAHLEAALAMLSDRKQPDYRNSIKESISAVESIAQVISSDPKAELGKALKLIEDNIGIHPALKKGFLAIYGYTSDEGGIRHAMLDVPNIEFEDAKYMLVSCSTFINYLIVKADKAGVQF